MLALNLQNVKSCLEAVINNTKPHMIETLQWVNFVTKFINQIFMYQYGGISKYNVGWRQKNVYSMETFT